MSSQGDEDQPDNSLGAADLELTKEDISKMSSDDSDNGIVCQLIRQ